MASWEMSAALPGTVVEAAVVEEQAVGGDANAVGVGVAALHLVLEDHIAARANSHKQNLHSHPDAASGRWLGELDPGRA